MIGFCSFCFQRGRSHQQLYRFRGLCYYHVNGSSWPVRFLLPVATTLNRAAARRWNWDLVHFFCRREREREPSALLLLCTAVNGKKKRIFFFFWPASFLSAQLSPAEMMNDVCVTSIAKHCSRTTQFFVCVCVCIYFSILDSSWERPSVHQHS